MARTGTVEFKNGRWQARCWVGEKRDWFDLDGIPANDRTGAKAAAALLQTKLDRHGMVPDARALTVEEWYTGWIKHRETRYPASWKGNKSDYELHLRQQLGHVPIRAVDAPRLADVVKKLDLAAAKGEMSGKTAINIWATCQAMFRDASKSKDRSLVVLDANPCKLVQRPDPDKHGRKAMQMLYPDEFSKLVVCTEVPVVRARIYALSLLLQTRASELRPLEWRDVDIAHRVVSINKREDVTRNTGVTKTKGKRARRVTIEETLVPLLQAMHKESGGKGRLFPAMPRSEGNGGLCTRFRQDLVRAGIDREELHVPTDTACAVRFHDLRATGATWRAARGDSDATIRQEVGHVDQTTTDLYLRRLRDLYGKNLFPALPARLGGCPQTVPVSPRSSESLDKKAPAAGLESAPDNRETPQKTARSASPTVREVSLGAGSEPPGTDLQRTIRLAAEAGQWDLVRALSARL